MQPSRGLKIVLPILRIALAIEFLWAFFDKLFGLGFATEVGKGWVFSGSPTYGFLVKGSTGPFAVGIYQKIGGSGIIDWLFMLALLCVGVALALGVGMRIGTIAGSVLMFLMWTASLPKPNNLFQIDDHVINILVLMVLLFAHAGQIAGLGKKWVNTGLVKRHPWLE